MADTLQFDLVSPERNMASGPATRVTAPGSEGDFAAMPGHAPFVTTLRPGVVRAELTSGDAAFVVFGGLVEVGPDRCAILADDVRPLAETDGALIDARISEAEKALDAVKDSLDGDVVSRQAQLLNDLKTLKTAV